SEPDGITIAIISTSDSGGAGKAAYRLHLGLEAAGIRSTMHVASKKSANNNVHLIPGIDPAGAPLHKKRNDVLAARYPRRPRGLEIFTLAESDVRLEGIKDIAHADIVHLHWVADLLDYCHVAQVLQGKKIVWTLHDMNPFTGGCHYAGECRRYLKSCGACPQLGSESGDDLSREGWLRKNEAYKNLDITVVAPSRWLAVCAQESALLGRFPVHVIPNGFPLDVFRPYSKDTVRTALNIDAKAKVVLFGADIIDKERKGFGFLLRALDILAQPKGLHDIVLAYFGRLPGPLTATLPYPAVAFGEVNDEHRLAMIYSGADVFVLPTLEDNLPNTVMEAMACGTPVVGFDVGGVPDMIDEKKTGCLVPPRDTQGLADAIAWVLEHHNGAGLSKNCREKALSFSLERQASAYHALYKQLLSKPVGNRRNFCNSDGKQLFVYVDPGFTHDIGHYTQMAAPLRRYARENGIAMLHYVGNNVPKSVCDELQLIPLFNYPAYIQLENKNLEAILQDFAQGLSRIKQEIEKRYADHTVRVYMYTCHPVHLPVFAKVFGSVACNDIRVFCNLFHIDRDFCNGMHAIHYEYFLRYVRWEFEQENKKNIVCITNESERSAALYEPFLGRQEIIDAQPVLDPPREMEPFRRSIDNRIILAYVGFPHERVGYPLVFRAYEAMMQSEWGDKVFFKIKHVKKHCNEETLKLYEAFTAQTKNIVHEKNFLSREAYDRFLSDCDIILIPYSKKYYPVNTSGMLVDALLRRKIVIVPEGTWMADQLQRYGAGVTFTSDNLESFLEAVKKAVMTFDDLARKARRNIEAFARKHSAEHFFSQLGFAVKDLQSREAVSITPAGSKAIACPACKSQSLVHVRMLKGQRSGKDIALFQCNECLTLHNPSGYREDDAALRADKGFHIRVAERNEGFSHALIKSLLSLHPRAATLLDVGAGIGTLMRIAGQYGLACYGVEPNRYAVEYARERYGLEITCDYYRSSLFDKKFDIITIIHVLEHLDEPSFLLQEAVNNINENGIVFVSVPFFNPATHSRFLENPELDGTIFFDNEVHINHFTVAGLRKMAEPFMPVAVTNIAAGWSGLAFRFSTACRSCFHESTHSSVAAQA
ncbi:MAG: glycosyltransferase, partial [Desulfobacterota bacterium]|nr:glycosyltransferase [Thermodesulfobacteriota bacterium]